MKLLARARLIRRNFNTASRGLKNHLLFRSRYFSLGARGERAARKYLEKRGYLIWEMNHRSKRGEIDIIASLKRTLVFVEVKTRTVESSVFPTELAIDDLKKKRLRNAGIFFVQEHVGLLRRRRTLRVRFDAILVHGTGRIFRPFSFRHIEGSAALRRDLKSSLGDLLSADSLRSNAVGL